MINWVGSGCLQYYVPQQYKHVSLATSFCVCAHMLHANLLKRHLESLQVRRVEETENKNRKREANLDLHMTFITTKTKTCYNTLYQGGVAEKSTTQEA